MSAALVPGRIRLSAPCSCFAASSASAIDVSGVGVMPGDLGPMCTSGVGGGEGRRGSGLDGEGDEGMMSSGRVNRHTKLW